MKNKNRLRKWRIIALSAIILVVMAFSPLLLKPGKTDPKLLSMPFTLWISIAITITLVVLTYIGGRIYLKNRD